MIGELSNSSVAHSVLVVDRIDEISAPTADAPIDIGEERLFPADDDPIFYTCASDMDSGGKLDRAMRVSPGDQKVITGKIREYLDDTRYRIGEAFVESNRTHCAPTFSILLTLCGVRLCFMGSAFAVFLDVVK